MNIFLFSACFSMLSLAIAAAETKTNVSERIHGLVEIPKVFGKTDPNGPPGQMPPKEKFSISLHLEPNAKSKVVHQLSKADDLIAREHGYEEESAVVYGHVSGWFHLKTKTGNGWLAPKDAGLYRRYDDLVERKLSFLDKNWNGRLYSMSGDFKNFEQQATTEDGVDVKILGKKSVGDELWFHVQIVKGRCEGEEKLGKKGWVPAYNHKSETNFWFYSRGC